jgi:hypothetical protein
VRVVPVSAQTEGMKLWLPGLLVSLAALAVLLFVQNIFWGIIFGAFLAGGLAFCAAGVLLSLLRRESSAP